VRFPVIAHAGIAGGDVFAGGQLFRGLHEEVSACSLVRVLR
jgi:hypothetical protein